MPCLRATMTGDTPCCRLSAAISRFCSAVQRRRRSRPVITSMRRLRMLVRLVVGVSSESNATAITLSSFLKDDRWPNFPRAAQCAAAISLTWGMLSRAAASQGALGATAAPVLAALAAETGENAYLIVRAGLEGEVLGLHRADPSLRVYVEPGKRFLLHAGMGRLLLAYAPDTIQTEVLSKRLPRLTPATRIDPRWIAGDLERIRSRGWLITSDEMFPGACAIATPVRDAGGDVVAAMTIAAPSLRMRSPRPRSLLGPVLAAATQMSEALGSARSLQPATPVRRVFFFNDTATAE